MPKILHINCSCTGSTGKIVGDIADYAVTQGYDTLLCAPCAPGSNKNIRYFRTSLPYEQGLYRRLNRLYGFQYGLAPLSTLRIKHVIKREMPDLIHIHCVNGHMVNVYRLLRYIKNRKIPVAFTNHAEFFYTGNCPYAPFCQDCDNWLTGCGHCPQRQTATGTNLFDTTAAAWRKMKKAFAGLENAAMASVSPWVGSRAQRSPITENIPQYVVMNGVNTDVFTCRDKAALREKYKLPQDAKIVFHATANFSASEKDRKGGRHLIALSRYFSGENVLFLVAGKHADNLSIPDNMRLLGLLSDQKTLAEYYALADITVVTGERETFNMPVAESLCCGTPVAGFCAGGPESIAIKQYSRFVPYGDVSALEESVQFLLSQNFDSNVVSRQAKQQYSAARMAEEYLRVYEKLLTKESPQSETKK